MSTFAAGKLKVPGAASYMREGPTIDGIGLNVVKPCLSTACFGLEVCRLGSIGL